MFATRKWISEFQSFKLKIATCTGNKWQKQLASVQMWPAVECMEANEHTLMRKRRCRRLVMAFRQTPLRVQLLDRAFDLWWGLFFEHISNWMSRKQTCCRTCFCACVVCLCLCLCLCLCRVLHWFDHILIVSRSCVSSMYVRWCLSIGWLCNMRTDVKQTMFEL